MALILLYFSDQPVPTVTRTSATATLGATLAKLTTWSRERTWWTTQILGPYQLPISSASGCASGTIAWYAMRAVTTAGVDLARYPRRVFLWSGGGSCNWIGLSTVGGPSSQTWLRKVSWTLFAHELGHALGLRHAKTRECGALVTDCAAPTTYEYGDPYDVMGHGNAQYSGAMREILGWAEAVDGTAGGIWTLGGPDGVAVLRLARSDGAWYYLTHLARRWRPA